MTDTPIKQIIADELIAKLTEEFKWHGFGETLRASRLADAGPGHVYIHIESAYHYSKNAYMKSFSTIMTLCLTDEGIRKNPFSETIPYEQPDCIDKIVNRTVEKALAHSRAGLSLRERTAEILKPSKQNKLTNDRYTN